MVWRCHKKSDVIYERNLHKGNREGITFKKEKKKNWYDDSNDGETCKRQQPVTRKAFEDGKFC